MKTKTISKGVVITWGKNITRSKSLAREMDLEEVHIIPIFELQILKLLNYLYSFIRSFNLIKSKSRDQDQQLKLLILVGPPTFIYYLCPLIKIMISIDLCIYADMHNGVLNKKWKNMPFLKYSLKYADLIICHNEVIQIDFENWLDKKVFVLTDPLPEKINVIDKNMLNQFLSRKKVNVLVPVSYAPDEPIIELLQAIENGHDKINFIITGNYKKKSNLIMPIHENNAKFTGYLSADEYFSLMSAVDIVLCLTTKDDIQMCAVNEAIGYEKALIYSKKKALSSIYANAGLAVDNDSNEIIKGIINVANNKIDYEALSHNFKNSYINSWGKTKELMLNKCDINLE